MMVALGLIGTGGALAPWSARAARHTAPEASVADFDRLMAQAEQQRDSGDHAAAARSYAAAYRGSSQADQSGLLGELAIDNALSAYAKAREQDPEELAFLEEPEALLADFITVRAQAHGAGAAEVVPERLEHDLERLRADIEQLRADIERRSRPSVVESPVEVPTQRRHAGEAILSGGVVALVGGAVLVGSGAWTVVTVNRRAEARLDELDRGTYSEERRGEFRAELSAWQDRWRRTSTGLVVAGSLLAAAGVGLTTWGAVRLRRDRRTSRRWSGLPMVVQGGVGVMVSLER